MEQLGQLVKPRLFRDTRNYRSRRTAKHIGNEGHRFENGKLFLRRLRLARDCNGHVRVGDARNTVNSHVTSNRTNHSVAANGGGSIQIDERASHKCAGLRINVEHIACIAAGGNASYQKCSGKHPRVSACNQLRIIGNDHAGVKLCIANRKIKLQRARA